MHSSQNDSSQNNSDHNGNGNGNGKVPPFVLAKPKTPEEIRREAVLKTIPKLRHECSKSRVLSLGAKWLFDKLTDLSFIPYCGDQNGTIYVTIRDLHRMFGHDRSAFKNWRDELIAASWIWHRELWPKPQWGISGVAIQPELFQPHMEAGRQIVNGGGQLAGAPDEELKRGGGGVQTSQSRQNAENAISGQNGGADQPDWRVLAASVAGQTSQSGGSGPPAWQARPASLEGVSRPEGVSEPASLADGTSQTGLENPSTLADGTSHINRSSPVEREGEEDLKRSTGLTPPKGGGRGPRKANPENLFLLEVVDVFERWQPGTSRAELSQSGAWWRLAYRQDPELMRRVLAEVLCAVKEGRIGETPGQMAVDTWKRWGGVPFAQ